MLIYFTKGLIYHWRVYANLKWCIRSHLLRRRRSVFLCSPCGMSETRDCFRRPDAAATPDRAPGRPATPCSVMDWEPIPRVMGQGSSQTLENPIRSCSPDDSFDFDDLSELPDRPPTPGTGIEWDDLFRARTEPAASSSATEALAVPVPKERMTLPVSVPLWKVRSVLRKIPAAYAQLDKAAWREDERKRRKGLKTLFKRPLPYSRPPNRDK